MNWKLLALSVAAIACSSEPINYVEDTGEEAEDTSETPAEPSFAGVWESNEMRFIIRNGGFDENGGVVPEGQNYVTVLPSSQFCIEEWRLTIQENLKAEYRVRYLNSEECTGGAVRADYVEESQWLPDPETGSVYVYPTRVENDSGVLPDPYTLYYSWFDGEGGFDLGVDMVDFDSDGAADDAQFIVFWRDLDA